MLRLISVSFPIAQRVGLATGASGRILGGFKVEEAEQSRAARLE